MEYQNSSEQFSRLPDEFNLNYQEEMPVQEPKKKNRFLYTGICSCVAALTLLIYPLSILPHDHHHSGPDFPPIEPDPPVTVEYDIEGVWENNGQYYQFLSDGNGFWTDGEIFNLLTWKKEGNDYLVEGAGVYDYGKERLSMGNFSFQTIYVDETHIVLDYHNDAQTSYHENTSTLASAPFAKSGKVFDLSNIYPYFGKPLAEVLEGEWENESYYNGPSDGMYQFLYSIRFSGRDAHLTFRSIVNSVSASYMEMWKPDDLYPMFHAKVETENDMYIEIRVSANQSYSYRSQFAYIYVIFTLNGPKLYVNALGNDNILFRP